MFRLFHTMRRFEREIEAPAEKARIQVELGNADLVIEGTESRSIKVSADYEAMPGKEGLSEELLSRFLVQEKEGELQVGPLPDPLDYLLQKCHLFVPKAAEISLHMSSGDVLLRDFSGKVKALSSSGDFRIEGVEGALEINSSSGDLRLSRVYGALEVALKSGDVLAEDLKGSLRIKSGSGDVHLEEFQGDLRIATGSGDVTVVGRPEEEEWRIKAGSGDVLLRIPKDSQLVLDLSASSGDVECELPFVAEKMAEGRLLGKLGENPKATIRVSTGSGDILVRGR